MSAYRYATLHTINGSFVAKIAFPVLAGNRSCLVHLPCSHGGTGGPTDADGPCFCCDLAIDAKQVHCEQRSVDRASHTCHIRNGLTVLAHVQVAAHWGLPTAVIWLLVISSLILPVSLHSTLATL